MKAIVGIAACALLAPSPGEGVEAESFEYRPATPAELGRVEAEWRSRDLRARNVQILYEEEVDGGRVMIVRHDMPSSVAHFGAIIVPDVDDLSSAPVVVLPDGLEQNNPTIDVAANIRKYRTFEPVDGFVLVIPSFRGRSMGYGNNAWFSRGDFCDAWDGPADDSIALLNAAEELLPEVSFEEVLVWGGSRGGNVAFLMAMRDSRVNTVIAIAAPTDFYRESWQIEGVDQYRCQFFDGRSEEEARHLILASSPLHFEPRDTLKHVIIHHDAGDNIVPVWNAREMADHLESLSVDVTLHVYPTEGHGHLAGEDSFWQNMREDVAAFAGRRNRSPLGQ